MYSSTHSLNSALDGGEWSASRPGRFTLRERAPVTHCIGGWVGPRAVLDSVVKRKIPNSSRESNPRTPVFQPVAQRYTDCAITTDLNDMWIFSRIWAISDQFYKNIFELHFISNLQGMDQNFNFWIYKYIWTFVLTPWTGDNPDARPIPSQDNTTQKNADTHPCPGRNSNLRSQCSSGRRQYVP
jgi:hypothetical protein